MFYSKNKNISELHNNNNHTELNISVNTVGLIIDLFYNFEKSKYR